MKFKHLSSGLGLGLPQTIKKICTRKYEVERGAWVDLEQQDLERRQRRSLSGFNYTFLVKEEE
jgi:hypothetical protein